MNPIYFDPNPLMEYNFDYTAAGSRSGIFSWYDSSKTGIFFSISGMIAAQDKIPSSGTPIPNSNIAKPDVISVNFTTYPAYNSIATEDDGVVKIYQSSMSLLATFSGYYPRFVNLSAIGGADRTCLYQDSGDIYYRKFSDSYATPYRLTNTGIILRPTLSRTATSNYFELFCQTKNYQTIIYRLQK